MGRELKRVAMGFDWPLDTVWKGFLRPEGSGPTECEACEGSGYSPEAALLGDQWYGKVPFHPEERACSPLTPENPSIRRLAERNAEQNSKYYGSGEAAVVQEAQRLCAHMNQCWSYNLNQDDVDALVEAQELTSLTHNWVQGKGWTPKEPQPQLTPADVLEWHLSSLGHSSGSQYVCTLAECKRRGVSAVCAECNGECHHWDPPEQQAAFDAWEPTEPPVGEGFQMWETVTEGSPISPVFATAEELAVWMAKESSRTGDQKTSAEGWLAFIQGPGWAPTIAIPMQTPASEP